MRSRRALLAASIGAIALAACSGGSPAARRHAVTTTTTRAPLVVAPRAASTTTTVGRTTTSTARRASPTTTTASRVVSATGLGAVAGRTIAIDPGHNGRNWAHTAEIARPIFIGTQTRACDTTGTNTADGYTESAYTLDVSLRLAAILRAAGAHVVLTRTTDDGWGPCIDERAAIGNRAHAAVAISIHADGGPAGGRGFHVNYPTVVRGYTDDIAAASYRLALDVRAAYASGTGMPPADYIGSGGLLARSDFGGLNLSDVPKVLFETANMRNATDAALVESPPFRQRAAQAIAAGLAAFLAGR
ncbi:MAG TPA: N-acetylmuramoyl-L-alanine amidase [Acidimicrobiia bacterium]